MPKLPDTTRRGVLLRLLVALSLLTAAGFALRTPILRALAAPLCVEPSPERPVDRILLASGDGRDRVAADWIREGRARGALVLRWPDERAVVLGIAHPSWWPVVRSLRARGVAADRIEVLDPPFQNEWDAALAIKERLEDRPEERIRVLCDELACGNLRRAVDRAFGGAEDSLDWEPLPDPRFRREAWWRSKHGVLTFFEAWVQRLHALTFGYRESHFAIWDTEAWVRRESAEAGRRGPGDPGS